MKPFNYNMKSTLVVGASENTERYSNKAMAMLKEYGHPVYAFGLKDGEAHGISIHKEKMTHDIHTITMYIGAKNVDDSLKEWLESLNPKRIIFNPGAENEDWASHLHKLNIQVEEACTLVLLKTDQY